MEENKPTKQKWDWADKAVNIDHELRKSAKKKGKKTLKGHYFLLFIVCLIVTFLGVETAVGEIGQTVFKSVYESTQEKSEDVVVSETAIGTDTTTTEEQNYSNIVVKLFKGDVDGAMQDANNMIQQRSTRRITKTAFGTQAGIFAGIVNKFEGGGVLVKIVQAFNKITKNSAVSMIIVIIISVLIYIAVWAFLLNILRVVKRRIFLEARLYDEVPIPHMLYLKNSGTWGRSAITMFFESLYLTLWSLTLVMYPVKHYAYWATQFIVAENPTLNSKQAITLSRKMMYGYKWKMFVYDLSYIGWDILSVITLGFLDYFFVEPYHTATDAEIYAEIRANYIANQLDDYEFLNDKYLFEKADQELLNEKYAENIANAEYIEKNRVKLTGAKKFFADNLGIWFGTAKTQKEYEDVELMVVENKKNEGIVAGKIYPGRLSPLAGLYGAKKSKADKLNYLKTYTVWSLLSMFFLFAFVGWGWEVLIHIVKDGEFINRGTMYGPWLPIYGGGAFLILTVLKRCRKHPVLLAVSTIILCGAVEYFGSWYLEMTKGMRWWDYTGYFLNINGRICGEGLMVFMLAGIAATYLIAPVLDRMILKIKAQVLIPILLLLGVTFLVDMNYSGKYPNGGAGVTNYTRYKEAEQNEAEDAAKKAQQKEAKESSEVSLLVI